MGLGDELMVTGHVRQLYERDPRKVRVEYEKNRQRWCELWDNNPKIARVEERGDFQVFRPRVDYLRPYCSAKSERQWTWKAYGPPRGEIYLSRSEKAFGDVNRELIVLGPYLKGGASPNKAWTWERWMELVTLFNTNGMRPVTIGPHGARNLGARHIDTSVREAAALLSRARLVITQEGALHHIAAAFDAPAIVIYGGYISPQVTGYPRQEAFFVGEGLGCGMRLPCAHCADAMASITPAMVFERARRML